MKTVIDIRKSVEENAASYFEKAKKDKKKIDGVKKIIISYSEKLKALESQEEKKQPEAKKRSKQEWYEKFRWFISSDDFIVIGGRDSTTNEIVIKKHSEKGDIVFHTDMAGSPFIVVKKEGKEGEIPKTTLDEAAIFTAAHSRGCRSRGLEPRE